MDGIVLITDNPNIKSIQDIKGKKLAATIASGEYQILQIVVNKLDKIDLKKDVEVIQASPADAWAQLKAKRVDAIMVWEPTTTLMLNENPNYNIFYKVNDKWKELTGNSGFDLSVAVREDYIKKYPGAVEKWIAALQDAINYIKNNLDEADKFVSKEIKLPPGVFSESIKSGRAGYDIRPVWEDKLDENIYRTFEEAVTTGYFSSKPNKDAFYKPEKNTK
jgi:sulfonate transport system substrate-binding protein